MAVLVLLAVVLWGVLAEQRRQRANLLPDSYWAGVARQTQRWGAG